MPRVERGRLGGGGGAWWRRGRVGVAVTVLAWAVVIAVAAVCFGARSPAWWMGERVGWVSHIASNFAVWIGVCAVFVGGFVLLLRVWGAGVVCVVSGLVCLSALVLSLPRAGSGGGGGGAAGADGGGWDGRVRVLHFNVKGLDVDDGALLRAIRSREPDVVALAEPGWRTMNAIGEDAVLGVRYGYAFRPRNVGKGTYAVFSRWPIVGVGDWEVPTRAEGVMAVGIETPGGVMGFGVLHPMSPRTPGTASRGTGFLRESLEVYGDVFLDRGLPVVVAADLNGTAVSERGRLMGDAGMRASKPLLRLVGTWPAALRPALRVPIDDVWVSAGVVSERWEALDRMGSDHVGVVVDLLIGPGAWSSGG